MKERWRVKSRFISVFIVISSLALVLRLFSVYAVALEDGERGDCDVRAAVERMRDGFYAFESEIDLSVFNISPEIIGSIFANATKNDPYLFFVDNHLSYTYERGGCVVSVKPTYNMSASEVQIAIEFCKNEVERIALLIGNAESELETALYLHDYLCRNFEYDLSLQNNDIYDFLRLGSGTCQGYTWTYMAILRELGIESQYVASDTINHIWNLVRIDGEWYHADVTWDDPPSAEADGAVSRRHFLCSDKKAAEQGHKDWYSAENTVCASATYDGGDFFSVLHTEIEGDTDHSYTVTLGDVIRLRLGFEDKLSDTARYCVKCSDLNGDGVLARSDIDLIREKMLGGSVDKDGEIVYNINVRSDNSKRGAYE